MHNSAKESEANRTPDLSRIRAAMRANPVVAGDTQANCERVILRIEQRPTHRCWAELALLLFEQQNPSIAADCYAEAVALAPCDAGHRAMLGICLAQQRKLPEAQAQFQQSIELDPARPATHFNLAIALVEQGKFVEAERGLREAIRLSADYSDAWKALARVLKSQARLSEVAATCRRALQLAPDDADLLVELGMVLAQNAATASEATILLKHSLILRPQFADGWNSLGLALMALGRFSDAAVSYEEAIACDPKFAAAFSNLGTNHKEHGNLAEALACFDMALRLEPGSISTHWNRALTLLQAGDYDNGWPEYECRWRRQSSPPRPFRQPMWDGSALDGRRIFLWCEQGLGDAVQFVRYAELVKERGGKVIFECPSPIADVLKSCQGIGTLLVDGAEEPLPPFDVHLPIMSAPFVFKTTLATVPARVPYLNADSARIAHWHEMIATKTVPGEFKVGIAWQGNPHHPLDRFRSVKLEQFRPLARVKGVRLFSLQRGPGTEQLDRWASDLRVEELTRRQVVGPDDWADTAAIISSLDLVISVDTAIAHVAGALGIPVWTALAACPDWRWMLRRGDTPWYPTMRLFRQSTLQDWEPVYRSMAEELSWKVENPARSNPTD